jgi:hypothetical protein
LRHQSLLAYANYRHLKVAVAVVAVTVGAYLWHRPPGGPSGGTWLGYTLGTVAGLLVLWLLWFGVRKRQYAAKGAPLVGWLSAHVYLGTALIVIATLHAAFQVGWNVHTLAYVLMLFVIFSGFYGVYAYGRFPRAMTDNLADDTQSSLLLKIADLDKQARALALSLPDSFNQIVLAAARDTRIGGSWRRQLDTRRPRPSTGCRRSARPCAARRHASISRCTRCCCASRSSSRACAATSPSRRASTCGCTSTRPRRLRCCRR